MVRKEGEPVSPIPALVPVCEQTAYIKSGPSSDRGKLEDLSSTKSNNSQLSVKSESVKKMPDNLGCSAPQVFGGKLSPRHPVVTQRFSWDLIQG